VLVCCSCLLELQASAKPGATTTVRSVDRCVDVVSFSFYFYAVCYRYIYVICASHFVLYVVGNHI
jgi:hypothetical protein